MIRKLSFILVFCILLVPPSQCSRDIPEQGNTEFNSIMSEADSYLRQQQSSLAIEKYNSALDIDKNSKEAYFNRGKAYFYSDDFVRACDDLSAALLIDPKYSEAYKYRGWANVGNGAIDRALPDFTELINLEQNSSYGYYGQGWCYLNQAQWSRSSLLYLYQKFESDAGLVEAFKGTSWHYVKELQWELSSSPDIKKEVEEKPEIDQVRCNRGFACFKKAQWDAAVRDLEKEIAINPMLDRSKWNLEWAEGKKKEWDLAIADYNKIAALYGFETISVDTLDDNLDTWYKLAVDDYSYIAESSGNSELALKAKNALEYMNEWRQQITWQFVK
jgi:tetratricopeptide (TPR) repeat protein